MSISHKNNHNSSIFIGEVEYPLQISFGSCNVDFEVIDDRPRKIRTEFSFSVAYKDFCSACSAFVRQCRLFSKFIKSLLKFMKRKLFSTVRVNDSFGPVKIVSTLRDNINNGDAHPRNVAAIRNYSLTRIRKKNYKCRSCVCKFSNFCRTKALPSA